MGLFITVTSAFIFVVWAIYTGRKNARESFDNWDNNENLG